MAKITPIFWETMYCKVCKKEYRGKLIFFTDQFCSEECFNIFNEKMEKLRKEILMEKNQYRAWHKSLEKYIEIKEFSVVEGEIFLIRYYDNGILKEGFVSDVILEPYIKLNDKNGREIYKGDILRTKNAVTIVGEPSWFNNCFGYDFEIAGGKNFIDKCRVVGNVHEDKVLL